MFFTAARAKWIVLPLSLGLLTLASCGKKTATPVASPLSSATSSVPVTSGASRPPAMSSSVPKGQMAMGMKPNAGTCPTGEPVKGKISKNGKIYHVPGSNNYAQVKPTTCFASSADAEKAGFRAPKH